MRRVRFRRVRNGYKIRFVSRKILKDYAGMNRPAARQLGFKPRPEPREIFIRKDLSPREKRETINHEIHEARLINKGKRYWTAHLVALKKYG